MNSAKEGGYEGDSPADLPNKRCNFFGVGHFYKGKYSLIHVPTRACINLR